MYRPHVMIFLLLIAFCLEGCQPSEKTVGSSGSVTSVSLSSKELSFQNDIVPVLSKTCLPCHTRNFYNADSKIGCRGLVTFENVSLGSHFYGGPLDGQLSGCPNRSLHERLTELDSWECPSMKYIVKGSPEKSFLISKMKGTSCGSKPIQTPPKNLTPEEIDLVERWIRDGANP